MSLRSWLPRRSVGGRISPIGVVLACALVMCGCARGAPAARQDFGGAALSSLPSTSASPPSTSAGLLGVAGSPAASQPDVSTADAEPATETPCIPGPTNIKGVAAIQHCGPARGQFTYDGKTVRVTPGLCQASGGAWAMNLGATVVGALPDTELRSQIGYLGIVLAQSGGSRPSDSDLSAVAPSEAIVAFTGAGLADSIRSGEAELTLAADGRSGTFSGPTHGGMTVTGKFDCGR